MTTVLAVAAALAFSCVLASVVMQVDGATLRRWRLSRRWDVSRLAREFIAAADEPLATVRGLTHMINAWERGARRPSERYWLLYLRVFPECAAGVTANGGARGSAAEAPPLAPAGGADQRDISTLAATVRTLEQQIAGLSQRLEEMSRDERGEGQPHQKSDRGKSKSGHWRWYWTPLWMVLSPSLS